MGRQTGEHHLFIEKGNGEKFIALLKQGGGEEIRREEHTGRPAGTGRWCHFALADMQRINHGDGAWGLTSRYGYAKGMRKYGWQRGVCVAETRHTSPPGITVIGDGGRADWQSDREEVEKQLKQERENGSGNVLCCYICIRAF